MSRRVVSVVRSAPVALKGADPALEAIAYAVCEAVDFDVVLAEAAVELAVDVRTAAPADVAGVAVTPASPARDVRALLESGVHVGVVADDLDAAGLEPEELVAGVHLLDHAALAALLRGADAVLTW